MGISDRKAGYVIHSEKETIMKKEELRYLQRLAELYPTIGKASTEIINLQSILNLPKGTEHFMSDLHGEYEAFSHVLSQWFWVLYAKKSMMCLAIH